MAALANILPLLAYLLIPGSNLAGRYHSSFSYKHACNNLPTFSGNLKSSKDAETVELCDSENSSGLDDDSSECNNKEDGSYESHKVLALACFFFCKMCAGLASQSYWTLGIAYMDDNVKTQAAAAVIGKTHCNVT